jgi:hypothetical protein
VRFRAGFATPIGGWVRRKRQDTGAPMDPVFAGATGVEMARNLVAWVDNAGGPHIVVGSNRGLYHVSSVGLTTNITPAGFVAGNVDSSEIVGYGVGLYGRDAYGTKRSGTGFAVDPVASWSLALFGENLIAQFRNDGKLYQWRPGTDVLAVPITGATVDDIVPVNSQGVIVTSERMVMTIERQPRMVRWSDVEDPRSWLSRIENQAGFQQLGGEGELRAHRQIGRDILILSTKDAHIGKYLGPPFVYGFEQVGQNCGTIAPLSLVVAAGRGYWVGPGGFWTYDGSVRRLVSEIDDWIRDRFSQPQISKTSGYLQPGHREIWWLFQSQTGTDCDAYVVYNYDDDTWSHGEIERTVGLTSGPSSNPLMIDYQGVLWDHEITGVLPTPPPWVETGPLEVANGAQQVGVQWLYPDPKGVGHGGDELIDSNATMTILGKDWPSPDAPERAYGPYTLTRPVPTTGARGRELRIRIDSVGSRWVAGRHRLKLTGLGER